ncbi:MAG: insulinase family protein [Saprospiraceae bacterium]|nr:insulinase family protein [Saprospiraceae bacterium]
MVNFEKHILKNGLKILLNVDKNTPLVAFNIMYNVGSKHENENKTGLAHLFEHLMFSGSKNVKDFDYHTQIAGGDNNAFTNNDITDFYITIPSANIETAFWLESDRMINLKLSKKQFSTEKKVVIEEFKETTLNVPYGDMWHHLSEMSYSVHPYKWPTIGKSIDQIKAISIEDVLNFYNDFYNPENAILSLSGDFDPDKILKMAEQWFGGIRKISQNSYHLPAEPNQHKYRERVVTENVPSNAIYMAFHVSGRMQEEYYAQDILSDILGRGRSSRLYQKLVKEKEYFSEIHAYISGSIDPGLLVIEGMISDNVKVDDAEKSIFEELELLKNTKMPDYELQKLKNKMENQLAFEEVNIMSKAINLGQYELLGDPELINNQIEFYNKVSSDQIISEANVVFNKSNCSKLIYLKN